MEIKASFKEDPRWDDITKAAIERGLEKALIFAQGQAKSKAPVDTGRLKNSISRETIGSEGSIFTDVEYSPYIEFGTKRQKAQPFLRPALFENQDKIEVIIAREIAKSL